MIRFSKYIWFYFLISAAVLVPGTLSLVFFGLRPAIDFTGGVLVEVAYNREIPVVTMAAALAKEKISAASIQRSSGNNYIVRLKPELNDKATLAEATLINVASETAQIVRNETVGPVLGKELLTKTVTAAIFAIGAILLYVAYAFRNIKFGVSAILALIHDLLVVLGVFSLLGKFGGVEVDTLFVTAFLTTMSFSVHDTIVVFDRIREMSKRGERMSFEALCDTALTETMGRSLANSFTIIFMLLALVLLGGETVQWFALALLVGTISGTYSSPFIATPILILWNRWEAQRRSH